MDAMIRDLRHQIDRQRGPSLDEWRKMAAKAYRESQRAQPDPQTMTDAQLAERLGYPLR